MGLTLEPGGIGEAVEVSAAAPLLQTRRGSVGEALTSTTILSFPIAGRDGTSLRDSGFTDFSDHRLARIPFPSRRP